MRPAILPKPTNLDEGQGIRGPDMWVDEAIWGHRLYDEQTPWLAFLEFLNVLHSEDVNGRALQEPNGHNTLEYRRAGTSTSATSCSTIPVFRRSSRSCRTTTHDGRSGPSAWPRLPTASRPSEFPLRP